MSRKTKQKIASRMNTKKGIFQKPEVQNYKLSTPMNLQHYHNALTIVAVLFKDVKTEELFSSQDQKLVETTNL